MTTQVTKSVIVNVPVSRAYNQWTQFEDFPQFMGGVQKVTQLSNDRLDHVNEALLSTPTYAHSLRGRDRSTLLVVADTVRRVLESLDPVGGAAGWLSAAGLTDDELQAIRVKLGVA